MQPGPFVREASAALEILYPAEEARSLALRLCTDIARLQPWEHVTDPFRELGPEVCAALEDALVRLLSGEPLQYVTGWQEFCGRRFRVGPGVLIPRPETEQLASDALSALADAGPGGSALDLCTGSGCIAWTLALESPDAAVTGVDISDAALEYAGGQFPLNAPKFIKADVLNVPDSFPGAPFDVLTANPPYIREEEKSLMHRNVLEHEPALALFVPDDDPLLFYRAIAQWALRFLAPGGRGFVEINEHLGRESAALFSAEGFADVQIVSDCFGMERFVHFRSR